MAWEFEALTLDEACARGLVRRGKDGAYLQRYYNHDGKRMERYIIGGRDLDGGRWCGVATAWDKKQAEWVANALNLAGQKIRVAFPVVE